MSVVLATSLGSLRVDLRYTECPKACFNFLALCASSYYDNCRFHRRVANAFVMSGDPTGTGKGGASIFSSIHHNNNNNNDNNNSSLLSSSSPQSLYFEDEGLGTASHDRRGVLAMAHKGNRADTNGSQFFILLQPCPTLDGRHTAFGVIDLEWGNGESERTLKELETLEVDEKYNVLDAGARIIGATVLYNPFAEGHIKLEI